MYIKGKIFKIKYVSSIKLLKNGYNCNLGQTMQFLISSKVQNLYTKVCKKNKQYKLIGKPNFYKIINIEKLKIQDLNT